MITCSKCKCPSVHCVCYIARKYDTLAYDSQYKCHHCGMIHEGRCPEVKSIEYYPNGTVKKVEYIDKPKDTSYWNR